MNNPFIWLGISILLVAISLIALLTVAILTLQELARAAKSAEKLLDTLNRELPVTLNDLRLTGRELSGLTNDVSGGVQSARNVVEQVDRSIVEARIKTQEAQITTRSFFVGASAALQVLVNGKPRRRRRPPTRRPPTAPVAESPPPAVPFKTPSAVPSAVPSEEPVQLSERSHKSTENSSEETHEKHSRPQTPQGSTPPLT